MIEQRLMSRYPQLCVPVRPGAKDSEEYRNAVLRGKLPSGGAQFIGSTEDRLVSCSTAAGSVDILYLNQRQDFEHAVRALAYRCEPADIPGYMGACTVLGLINWEKIRRHRMAYLASGGSDWKAEFKLFTAEKANYQDSLIIIGRGNYSAVPAEMMHLDEKLWEEKSLVIRKYHELTHFVSRGLYPEDIDPIRDEVIADMVGIAAAFGYYDSVFARLFLGIESGHCREGGRLTHYTAPDEIEAAAEKACKLIEEYAGRAEGFFTEHIYTEPERELIPRVLETFLKK